MRRSLGENGKEAFRASTHAYVKDFEASVKRRRRDMDEEWRDIDVGWTFVEKRMAEVGFKPAGREDCLLRLDVGGEPVDIWRTSLSDVPETKKSRLTALLEGVWDGRLPRLSNNGRIVLDESPSCFKRLLEIQLGDKQSLEGDQAEKLEKHDEPYTKHLASCLRVDYSSLPRSVDMRGGSTVLRDGDQALVSPQLYRWLSNVWTTPNMNLVYRASVHGFYASSFHARCDSAESTIMLIRVRSSSTTTSLQDSVVGAFSSAPWTAPSSTQGSQLFKRSPDNFIFLLNDDIGGAPAEKWPIDPKSSLQRGCSKDEIFFRCCFSGGTCQKHALRVHFPKSKEYLGSIGIDSAACYFGNTRSAKAFLALKGASIVELEVFSQLRPSRPLLVRLGSPGQAESSVHSADLRSFGVSMAGCLKRERRAIEEARDELESAGDKVEAAAEALKAVYGPDVAAGVEDSVVELNVRGKALTTLRSTLRLCPESALAARFNEDRWPLQSGDLAEDGRYLVDCCPLCFRKVLDVLRIRKRAGWSRASVACNAANNGSSARSGGGETSELQEGRLVGVSKPHRECFGTLVGMYFPGCETFITDLVDFDILT